MVNSGSERPDLDWSQVRETVKMLTLSVAHLQKGMEEGDSSVNTLTNSFTYLVEHVQTIHAAISEMQPSQNRTKALQQCLETSDKIQSSIVAFQFYDRLQQNLDHVARGLSDLSGLVENPQRLFNPMEWKKLQMAIRERYTMEGEKAMFDAILQGKTVAEAMQIAAQTEEADEDDIELF